MLAFARTVLFHRDSIWESANVQRRDFLHSLGRLSLACGAVQLTTAENVSFAQDLPAETQWPVAIFTKVFQRHSYEQLAELVVEIEADGVEATVRRGGHIQPGDATQEVPKMAAALAKAGKRLLLASTDITAPGGDAEVVLKSLRDSGVTHYRTGYYRYGKGESRLDQVRKFAEDAKRLAELNQRIGIVGVYQNHAGDQYLGNVIWDLAMLMERIDPAALGVALDLRHLRAEIGVSWRAMIDLIQPHVVTVFAKNSTWIDDGKPQLVGVPLGEGMADAAMFRGIWEKIQRPAPLSVHVEYLGQDPLAVGETGEMVAACRRDVAVLRSWMQPEGR
jgi:sugar phosphate isomerase/epimerase